ncbi:MAG: cytochrome d ubiquinol oxidase subunit II [Planctomycetota bacterium]
MLGGADFGAGVWEFTNAMQSDDRERKLIAKAIGPVWEANHVWLIFVLIIILNGFPIAFAAISRALWVPLLLALAGIVFRGAGFVFRAYAVGADWMRQSAGAIFALASTSTPFFMGMAIGALSCGTMEIAEDGTYTGNHLHDWITPLSIYSGILAVGMCAYLASVYLTREASMGDDGELLARWRGRALSTGIWIGILAWLGLLMCWLEAPMLWSGLIRRGWPLILGSMLAGVGSLFALRSSQFRAANLLAALAVAAVIVGWGLGQYPLLVPPAITIQSAKSPDVVLWAMAICILIGALVMFPALGWLFWIFKSRDVENDQH